MSWTVLIALAAALIIGRSAGQLQPTIGVMAKINILKAS